MICKNCGSEYKDSEKMCPTCWEKNENYQEIQSDLKNVSSKLSIEKPEFQSSRKEESSHQDSLDLDDLEPINISNSANLGGNSGNSNTYHVNQQSGVSYSSGSKKKIGIIVAILGAIAVGVGIYGFTLGWFQKDKKDAPTDVAVETENLDVDEFYDESIDLADSMFETPTMDPNDTSLVQNVDYILIKDKRYSTSLTKLQLCNMGLRDEDVKDIQYLKDLQTIIIDGNYITNLDFLKSADQLYLLEASDNDITDLSALSGKHQLKYLYLSFNKFEDLSPLMGLDALSSIHIDHTSVTNLEPLITLKNLSAIHMEGAKVSDISCLSKIASLEYCDITEKYPNTMTIPVEEAVEGFTYTTADKKYFKPKTRNFMIAYLDANPTPYHVLVSFDENKMCVEYRVRMDTGMPVSQGNITEYLKGEQGKSFIDMHASGTVMYATMELQSLPQVIYLETFTKDGNKILVQNYKKESVIPEIEGLEMTDLDNEYLIPKSDNYIILNRNGDDYIDYFLFSFDENDQCIQHLERFEYKEKISDEFIKYIEMTYTETTIKNMEYEGNIVYFDFEPQFSTKKDYMKLIGPDKFTLMYDSTADK